MTGQKAAVLFVPYILFLFFFVFLSRLPPLRLVALSPLMGTLPYLYGPPGYFIGHTSLLERTVLKMS